MKLYIQNTKIYIFDKMYIHNTNHDLNHGYYIYLSYIQKYNFRN